MDSKLGDRTESRARPRPSTGAGSVFPRPATHEDPMRVRKLSNLAAHYAAAGIAAFLALLGPALPAAAQEPPDAIARLVRSLLSAAPAAAPPAEPLDERAVRQSETGLLDVQVRDAEIATILQMLSYQSRTNIVASTAVKGGVSANLYGVTLREALDAILTPNGYAYIWNGRTVFVGTPAEVAAQLPPPKTRVFHLKYITRNEAKRAVEPLLSAAGKLVVSSEPAAVPGGTKDGTLDKESSADYLIVSDYDDRLKSIGDLLTQIDVRPRQVLIEATILRATLNEGNQFGIDFTMLGGVDFQNVGGASVAATNLSLGGLPPDDLQQTTFNISTSTLNGFPDGGFTLGLIKDSIAGFVRALEDVTDVTVVANPKLIALNKQPAEVIVGRRDGYLTTTVTETAAIQTVEFLETGTQIRFQPNINDDGTVRLEVHPKDSNGGLTAANLPFEETTEAHANIIVNDGNTVLIGGLFRERTVSSRAQVPGIGDIPGLGLLFQRINDTTVREEIIILITVHILKDTPQEDAQYAELLDDAERVRVGTRKGLFGIGRERLAQAYYQEAVAQLEAGKLDLALLNCRMALHNQPKFLAALNLKERLLQQRLWDNEGSRSRTLIRELIDESGHAPPDSLGRAEDDLDLYHKQSLEPPENEP